MTITKNRVVEAIKILKFKNPPSLPLKLKGGDDIGSDDVGVMLVVSEMVVPVASELDSLDVGMVLVVIDVVVSVDSELESLVVVTDT